MRLRFPCCRKSGALEQLIGLLTDSTWVPMGSGSNRCDRAYVDLILFAGAPGRDGPGSLDRRIGAFRFPKLFGRRQRDRLSCLG
jgi:hypothetical protein